MLYDYKYIIKITLNFLNNIYIYIKCLKLKYGEKNDVILGV
jgi:hypothetical protein